MSEISFRPAYVSLPRIDGIGSIKEERVKTLVHVAAVVTSTSRFEVAILGRASGWPISTKDLVQIQTAIADKYNAPFSSVVITNIIPLYDEPALTNENVPDNEEI